MLRLLNRESLAAINPLSGGLKTKNITASVAEFRPGLSYTMEKSPALYSRLVSILVMGFVGIALLWLYFAKVDIVVSASGNIVPSGKTKVVQAAQAGVVRDIFVRDGMSVKRGDPLIVFDTTLSDAELLQIRRRLDKAILTTRRLKYELGEEVDFELGVSNSKLILAEQKMLASVKQQHVEHLKLLGIDRDKAQSAMHAEQQSLNKVAGQISHNAQLAERTARHAAEGLIAGSEAKAARFTLQDSRKQFAIQQQKVNEAKKFYDAASLKISSANIEHKKRLLENLAESESELDQANKNFVQATQEMTHQTLRAPVDGIVQQLTINTVGAVISRAEQLLVLIPANTGLEVEAQILNKDIGFVDREQESRIKVDAFEYTRYGYLDGEIDWVASDSVIDDKKGPVYPARIKLNQAQLPRRVNNKIASVQPGMSVTVDVVIGTRRLIEYFSGPLLRYQDESLTER